MANLNSNNYCIRYVNQIQFEFLIQISKYHTKDSHFMLFLSFWVSNFIKRC